MTTATRTRKVRTIRATTNRDIFTASSNSTPGVTYTVTIDGTCNCPGYVNHGHCWHSDTARAIRARRIANGSMSGPKLRQPASVDLCEYHGKPRGPYGCSDC